VNVVAEDEQFRFDWLKWLVVLTLLGSGIYGNWYYSAEPLLYRVLALVTVTIVSGLIVSKTEHGNALVTLAIGARTEWYKVIWPTRQECNQTTLMVVAIILLMALILWGMDSLLSWGASLIMS
jgi:preprotein translocase subunit SecE